VQRQYSGTAGRIENSQIGVFLCYAGHGGSAFIDRELYVPQAWTDDRARCEAAGIPESVEFATKPQIACSMLERALDAGVPCGWVTGDEVYGGDRQLRLWLESRAQPFVLAVAKNEPLWWEGPTSMRADKIAQALPARAWRRLSAGAGAKGERLYDWALTPLWRLTITGVERIVFDALRLCLDHVIHEGVELTFNACAVSRQDGGFGTANAVCDRKRHG
jgi:SRSO17 transposase